MIISVKDLDKQVDAFGKLIGIGRENGADVTDCEALYDGLCCILSEFERDPWVILRGSDR